MAVPHPRTLIKDGWVVDCSDYHNGSCHTYKIDELLYHEKSESVQDILIIKKLV